MKDFISFDEHKKKILADPEVRKHYDTLAPEYQLIHAIIKQRLKKKMTQGILAHKVGTRQSAISRLESGNSNPSIGFLKKIARAFDMTLNIQFQ